MRQNEEHQTELSTLDSSVQTADSSSKYQTEEWSKDYPVKLTMSLVFRKSNHKS